MTRPATTRPNGQPSLQDLTLRFLATRSDAAPAAVELAGTEVEPHQVAAGFRVDPRAAWVDANAALGVANPGPAPAEWAALVGSLSPVSALPFAAGNHPQRVQDLHPLLADFSPSGPRPRSANAPLGSHGPRVSSRTPAAKHQPEAVLRAVGLARAAGDLDAADELLTTAEVSCTGDLWATWENERAALLWERGDGEAALAAWEAMPETPPALFNRGMALLFLDRPADARPLLARAAGQIAETSGWNALARLYLALAEIHG